MYDKTRVSLFTLRGGAALPTVPFQLLSEVAVGHVVMSGMRHHPYRAKRNRTKDIDFHQIYQS